MKQYSVVIVGMGKRGMHHGAAFNANPRFMWPLAIPGANAVILRYISSACRYWLCVR